MVQAKKIISSIALFLVIFGTNKGIHAHASMARTIAANSGSLLSKAKNSVISAAKQHPKIATVAALATLGKMAIICNIKMADRRYAAEIQAKIKKLEAELAQLPAEEKRDLELKIEGELTIHRPSGETEAMKTDNEDPITLSTFADHIQEQAKLGNYAIVARYVTQASNGITSIKHDEAQSFNTYFFKKRYPINLNKQDYYAKHKDVHRSSLMPGGTIEYYIFDHYRPEHGLQYLCSYGSVERNGREIYTFYNNQKNSPWYNKNPQSFIDIFYANQDHPNGLKLNAAKKIYHDDATSYFYDQKDRWLKTQRRSYLELNLEVAKKLVNARKEYTFSAHIKKISKVTNPIAIYPGLFIGILFYNTIFQGAFEVINYLQILNYLSAMGHIFPAYTITFTPTAPGSTLPAMTFINSQRNFQNMTQFARAQCPSVRYVMRRIMNTSLLGTYVINLAILAAWAAARSQRPYEVELGLWEAQEAKSLNIEGLMASGEQAIQKQREALEQEAAKLRAQSVQ